MTLLVFGLAWIVAWAACWFGLARVWPYSLRWTFPPGPSEAYDLSHGRRTVSRGARFYAPLIATVVAFAVSWATGGL